MNYNIQIRSIVFGIIASCILTSCDNPANHNPIRVTYSDINIVSADGSGHRRILGERSYYANLLLTKNGILYSNNNFSLYSMKYDGSNQNRLFSNIPWGDWSFSPDESKLLLSSYLLENNQYSNYLYLMNADGSNAVQLAPQKGQYLRPRISPMLDEIVFTREGGIATINVDGTHLQYIRTKTDSTHCLYGLYVDQDRIFYVEQAKSILSMRLFTKSTRQDRLLVTFPGGWSPYGEGRVLVNRKLVYTDVGMIKVLDIDASSTSILGQGFFASYSWDGSRIVYTNGRSIYTMTGNGSNQQTIFTEQDSTKYVAYPQFSTDEKKLIFITSYTVVTP